ncbi:hypothetical protein ACLMJK_008435 [Lecanora helva]
MAEDAPNPDETPVTFNVKSSSEAKYVLTIPLTTTVLDLKTKLSGSDYADIPPDRQRLIYSGRVLKDADTLGSYKIKEGNTVHLVKGAQSNVRQQPANQGASTGTNTGANASQGVPQNLASGTGRDPLAGLTGARYAGFAQMPNANMFGPDGGMGPPPDPESMASMLENPNFQSTLSEALSNPDVVDQMIRSNPMLRDMGPQVRQMMQDPNFRRMMTDPQALRQMSQMQRAFGGGGGMFGGMGGGGAGAGGEGAFPAPGVTDTTPEGAEGQRGANAQQTDNTPQPPPNPFAMFGNQAGGAGGGAGAANGANPFAALFGTGGIGGGAPGSTPGQQQQQPQQPNINPMASMAQNLMNNPQLMQQMLGSMGSGGGGQQQQQPGQNDAAAGSQPNTNSAANAGFNPFAALQAMGMGNGGFGGFGAPPPPAPQDDRPPEDRYAEQLRQLNDMGFYEFERNVEALRRTGGSVQGAVEYLLNH